MATKPKSFKDLTPFQKAVMVRHLAKLLQHAFIASALPENSDESITSTHVVRHLNKRFMEKYGHFIDEWEFINWTEQVKVKIEMLDLPNY